MMLQIILNPTREQELLYKAVKREFERQSGGKYSEQTTDLVVANFVSRYDFKNSALAHKSAGGWAQMLLSELQEVRS